MWRSKFNFATSDSASSVFEQSPELNKYVDPNIPLTWATRWNALRFTLPLLFFSSVIMMEMVAFRLWLNDRSLLTNLHLLLGVAALPVASVFVALEGSLRSARKCKRILKLEPKRVAISPAKYKRISWHNIKSWQIEPLADAAGLSKLTVEYSLGKRGTNLRQWAMVLKKPEQERVLISALESLRQSGVSSARLIQLSSPAFRENARPSVRTTVAITFALFFLVHGLPLLMGGLSNPNSHDTSTSDNSRFTAREKAKLQLFVSRHFASRKQYSQFCVAAGGGMTTVGAVLYIYAFCSVKKSKK